MPPGTGLKSVLARDRFDKEAALNLSSHSRGASGRLRGSAARHNGARAFLRRLMLLPSRLKLRRASQTVRSLASSRPYLVWMSIGATACLGVWLLVIGFQLVLTPFCGNSREMLCALSAKRGGRSLPELMSEGELAADGGESMLKAVGRDVNAPDVGSGWQLAHATPPAASRTEARIAYFIQVGADSVALLPRLFRRLHHPDNVYVVHIDAKVGASDHESAQSLVHESGAYRKNIHFLPSEMITYKGVSMVVNTIAGMTLARRVDPDWDYFVNLSGADYPLLTPTDQRRLLARPGVAPGRLNFMSFFPKHEWAPYAFRVKYQYWDPAVVGYENPKSRVRRMKSMRLNPLEHLRLYTFVKAEAWMILSRQFCDFIVRSDFAKKMLLNHAHVLSAPEHYFADVLYNHPTWKKTLVPDAFRKVCVILLTCFPRKRFSKKLHANILLLPYVLLHSSIRSLSWRSWERLFGTTRNTEAASTLTFWISLRILPLSFGCT
jgi:Core-2/I-Branching enzyme